MKQFIHRPRHLKTHRILPGHGQRARFTSNGTLPDVDRDERTARRHTWTDRQAARRAQYGRGNRIGLAGAVLALVLALSAALGPHVNVLDASNRPGAEPAHLVAAPAPIASATAVKS